MNPALIPVLIEGVAKYGPTLLVQVLGLIKLARENKTEVTPDDIQQIVDLGKKSSADYLSEAGGAPSPSFTVK